MVSEYRLHLNNVVLLYVCVCVCACVRACVRSFVSACTNSRDISGMLSRVWRVGWDKKPPYISKVIRA